MESDLLELELILILSTLQLSFLETNVVLNVLLGDEIADAANKAGGNRTPFGRSKETMHPARHRFVKKKTGTLVAPALFGATVSHVLQHSAVYNSQADL